MKILSNLRYILFAISIVGLFANFAQNDYSWGMIFLSYGGIGIIFLIEMIVLPYKNRANKKLAGYLFVEHLFLFLISMGFLFKYFSLIGGGVAMVLGCTGLALLYLFYGLSFYTRNFKRLKTISYLVLLFSVSSFFLALAFVFEWQHWSWSYKISVIASIFFAITVFSFRRKFKTNEPGETNNGDEALAKKRRRTIILAYIGVNIIIANIFEPDSFQFQFLKLTWLIVAIVLIFSLRTWSAEMGLTIISSNSRGKMLLMFVFFSFWVTYFNLVILGSAPKMYSSHRPPVLEKMIEERYFSTTKTPEQVILQIETYQENYQNFLKNRKADQQKNEGE